MACRIAERSIRGRSAFPLKRSFATSISTSTEIVQDTYAAAHLTSTDTKPVLEDTFYNLTTQSPSKAQTPSTNPFITRATCTIHEWPSMRPSGMISYPSTHLLLPLRKDILHRAVVFEGDRTRQGTASTKWRDDVHGSGRKIRPQKGTGQARLGDKKSPMLRGGGVAFGPTPRDFSTKLPRKIYDLAWRTALSFRYQRGELIVLDGSAEIPHIGPGSSRWFQEVLSWHKWGRAYGRSLFVTERPCENLAQVLRSGTMGAEAKLRDRSTVDVKDLLETGRMVIEKDALREIFATHSSDLSREAAVDMTVHSV